MELPIYIISNNNISAASMSSFSARDTAAEVHIGIMMVWKTPNMADVQETFRKTLGEHGIGTDNLKRRSTYLSTVLHSSSDLVCHAWEPHVFFPMH